MGTRQERFFRDVLAVLDAGALVLAFLLAYILRDLPLGEWLRELAPFAIHAPLLGVILPVWLFFLRRFKMHESAIVGSPQRLLAGIVKTQVMSGLVLFSMMLIIGVWAISRLFLLAFILISGILLFVVRRAACAVLNSSKDWHGLGKRRTLIVANSRKRAVKLTEILESLPLSQHEIVGYLSVSGNQETEILGRKVLGSIEHAENILRSMAIDEVITAAPSPGERELSGLATICLERGVTYRSWIDLPSPYEARPYVEAIGERSFLLSLETAPLDPFLLLVKRIVDVLGATVGLLATGIVHLWYGWRLKRESPGPVYFRQLRVGQHGRPFILYKFRTMHLDAEERLAELKACNEMAGSMFKMRDDPRLLLSGRSLRTRHLDELPQFWNVMRGEMSLVGTRPPTVDEVSTYRPHHFRRLGMKPGITGLWQIEGNGRVSNFEDIVRLDRHYIDNWSLWLDCTILAKTLMKVARGEGW